jgi:hypothetical protein
MRGTADYESVALSLLPQPLVLLWREVDEDSAAPFGDRLVESLATGQIRQAWAARLSWLDVPMSEEEVTYGTDWTSVELDLIVADYFAMLADELAGRPYAKAAHNAALRERIPRSRGSVEFKYQNVSAVLEKLGMPWIPGYKPARHYQSAIVEVISGYLASHPAALDMPAHSPSVPALPENVFVPPPALVEPKEQLPTSLRRLIAKFDPVERDRRNRSLGRAGEEFVIQLAGLGRQDLSRKVRWIADEEGDGAGYDVLSFAPTGQERLLEVKTTNGSARTPFFLSRNELEVSKERQEDWRIYRVHLFATSPRIFTLAPPLDGVLHLRPELWRASL